MIKLKSFIEESHLIPRRSKDDRLRNCSMSIQKFLYKYVRNGCKGDIDLSHCPCNIDFPTNMKTIHGNLDISDSPIENLPENLHTINGSLNMFRNYSIKNIRNIKSITGVLNAAHCEKLTELTSNPLRVDVGIVAHHTGLKKLPETLSTPSLDISFTNVETISDGIKVSTMLVLNGTQVSYIPKDINVEHLFLYKTPFLDDFLKKTNTHPADEVVVKKLLKEYFTNVDYIYI